MKGKTGDKFEVHLKTRKQAQTGVGHCFFLYANDKEQKICPVRALIRLFTLYDGEKIEKHGPLFLKVDNNGAVVQSSPMVCAFQFPLVLPFGSDHLCNRHPVCLAVHWPLTCKALGTSLGPCMGLTPSVEVAASIASRTRHGPLTWWQHGEVGPSLKLSPCSATSTPPTTTMSSCLNMTGTCQRGIVFNEVLTVIVCNVLQDLYVLKTPAIKNH